MWSILHDFKWNARCLFGSCSFIFRCFFSRWCLQNDVLFRTLNWICKCKTLNRNKKSSDLLFANMKFIYSAKSSLSSPSYPERKTNTSFSFLLSIEFIRAHKLFRNWISTEFKQFRSVIISTRHRPRLRIEMNVTVLNRAIWNENRSPCLWTQLTDIARFSQATCSSVWLLDVFTLAPPAFKYKTPIVCIRIFRRIHLIQGKPYEWM